MNRLILKQLILVIHPNIHGSTLHASRSISCNDINLIWKCFLQDSIWLLFLGESCKCKFRVIDYSLSTITTAAHYAFPRLGSLCLSILFKIGQKTPKADHLDVYDSSVTSSWWGRIMSARVILHSDFLTERFWND